LTIQKYVLTSWTLRCTDSATGEDIYFDNRVPEGSSWPDEDRALQEIGKLIADSFSHDFFAEHLPRTSRQNRLVIRGIPSEDSRTLLRQELLGLRSVAQAEAQDAGDNDVRFAVRWYDQGPGGEQSFDGTVLAPLRRKFGSACLPVESQRGGDEIVVRLAAACAAELGPRLETLPPAALCEAPAERLAALARSVGMMQMFAQINPDGVGVLAARGLPLARDALAANGVQRIGL
jgi:serine/threonine-protein kinase